MPERERWRMTLQELCHRTGATPADLNEWARLGAFGPAWAETTENKWRHITRAVARRAVVMRAMLDVGLEPAHAASVANLHADEVARGREARAEAGAAVIVIDPEKLDMP